MVKFQCHHCKGIMESDGMASGEQVHCGHCEEIVEVPIPLTPGTIVDDFIIKENLGNGVFKCLQMTLDVPVILHTLVTNNSYLIDSFISDAREQAKERKVHVIGKSKDYDNFYFHASMIAEIRVQKPVAFVS
ncbi:MAG: hypothetical protein NE327_00220 [Lentisphaeraceae bacterium]|nr:hypothetical protein [Lentisphaeraceae bacterium]